MKDFLALAVIFWIPPFISILKSFLWDLYFWQVKEYRFDRFWVFIRWDQEPQNRNVTKIVIKFILFSLVSVVLVSPLSAALGIFLAYIFWFNESLGFLQDFLNKKLKRPALSVRNILILLIAVWSIILVICLISIPFALVDRDTSSGIFLEGFNSGVAELNNALYPDILIYLSISTLVALLIELSSPFLVSLFVLITYPVSKLRREMIISKAKKKIAKLDKKPLVIGITGSAGKTTTKEILFEMLEHKFKTGKTVENQNTDVGLSLSILENLKNNTEVFIAEMGALRISEIKNMCKILTPDISIVSDVATQHIGIFGSQEKLFKAKSEIVEYTKVNGKTVLNGDNEYCLKMIRKDCKNYVYYSTKSVEKYLDEKWIIPVYIHSESEYNDRLEFKLNIDKKDYSFSFKLEGKHLIHNLAACICTCLALGMDANEIQYISKDIKTKLPRLTLQKGDNDTLVIDDTYSSNEKGFAAAVKFMDKQKGTKKRIVVTKGIIELGRHKEHIYKKLVNKIKNDIDVLITSDHLLHKMILKDNTKVDAYYVHTNEDFKYTIRKVFEPKDIILLEGRLHPSIISDIVSEET